MGKSFFEKRSVFSIRKLAVGACSVLIGVSFFGAPSVLAEEEGRAVTEEETTATTETSELTNGEVGTSDKVSTTIEAPAVITPERNEREIEQPQVGPQTSERSVGATEEATKDQKQVAEDMVQDRERDFNKDWYFKLNAAPGAEGRQVDIKNWKKLDLPHDWSIFFDFDHNSPAQNEGGQLNGGDAWYRKTFRLDDKDLDKKVRLEFGGVYMDSKVYVNGQLVGHYPNGYNAFSYDITPYLNADGSENTIAVHVVNQQPSSRWYSGSGIYRDVKLSVTDKVHVAKYGTTITSPKLEEQKNGAVDTLVKSRIVNQDDQAHSIYAEYEIVDQNGQVVSEKVRSEVQSVLAGQELNLSHTLHVEKPTLWDVKTNNPALYTLYTRVYRDSQLVDVQKERFGYRYLNWTPEGGFFLNGVATKFHGVSLHHDHGALGAEENYKAEYRRLKQMKDMGVNAIRTTHNPASEQTLQIAAELGLMVQEEAFDTWYGGKKQYDYGRFFEKDATHPEARKGDKWSDYDLRTMVERGKNNPSIVMWSIGNEIGEADGSDKSVATVRRLVKTIKEVDATRYVTMGADKFRFGDGSGGHEKVAAELDAVGFNYSEANYESLRAKHPNWLIYGSETSSATRTRGSYYHPEREWVGSNQEDRHYEQSDYGNDRVGWGRTATASWTFDRDHAGYAGQFIWTGTDYIGEPTPWHNQNDTPVKSSYFGIVDTAGLPKNDFYLYQSQWLSAEKHPMVHLLPHWNWDNPELANRVMDEEGRIPVRTFSNAHSVELIVNGESQGVKTFTKKTTADGRTYQEGANPDELYLEWLVSYVPGKVEAIARNEAGEVIARDQIETAGKPAGVRLLKEEHAIAADGKDLTYITYEIVDEAGRVVPTANNLVHFHLHGQGQIVGVDNGEQASRERYKAQEDGSWQRRAFNGKGVVIVKSTEQAGSFTLYADSDRLQSDQVSLFTGKKDQEERSILGVEPVRTQVYLGEVPELPSRVSVVYNDGMAQEEAVEWDAADFSRAGQVRVTGHVQGRTVEALVDVIGVEQVLPVIKQIPQGADLATVDKAVQLVFTDGRTASYDVDQWTLEAGQEEQLSTPGARLKATGLLSNGETVQATLVVAGGTVSKAKKPTVELDGVALPKFGSGNHTIFRPLAYGQEPGQVTASAENAQVTVLQANRENGLKAQIFVTAKDTGAVQTYAVQFQEESPQIQRLELRLPEGQELKEDQTVTLDVLAHYQDGSVASLQADQIDVVTAAGSQGKAVASKKGLELREAGLVHLQASFQGQTGELTFTITPNPEEKTVVKVRPVRISTDRNVLPALPETVLVEYDKGFPKEKRVTWDAVTADQVKDYHSFTVTGQVEGVEKEAQAQVTVEGIIAVEEVSTTTPVGEKPALPESVRTYHSNGKTYAAKVAWDAVDPQLLAQEGEVVVSGRVEGTNLPTRLHIRVSSNTVKGANVAEQWTGSVLPLAFASDSNDADPVAKVNDKVISFTDAPANRWTNWGRDNAEDSVGILFGDSGILTKRAVDNLHVGFHEDHGVGAPSEYVIEYYAGEQIPTVPSNPNRVKDETDHPFNNPANWKEVSNLTVQEPVAAGKMNHFSFDKVDTYAVRIRMKTPEGKRGSSISEIQVFANKVAAEEKSQVTIRVNGEVLPGVNPSVTDYYIDARDRAYPQVEATASHHGLATVVPSVHEGEPIRVVHKAEDGTILQEYRLHLTSDAEKLKQSAPVAVEAGRRFVKVGQNLVLPSTVGVYFKGDTGYDRKELTVDWQSVPADALSHEGSFTLEGKVLGYDLTARLTVRVSEKTGEILSVNRDYNAEDTRAFASETNDLDPNQIDYIDYINDGGYNEYYRWTNWKREPDQTEVFAGLIFKKNGQVTERLVNKVAVDFFADQETGLPTKTVLERYIGPDFDVPDDYGNLKNLPEHPFNQASNWEEIPYSLDYAFEPGYISNLSFNETRTKAIRLRMVRDEHLKGIGIVELSAYAPTEEPNATTDVSIQVNGKELEGFNPDVTDYHLEYEGERPIVSAQGKNGAAVTVVDAKDSNAPVLVKVVSEDGKIEKIYQISLLAKAPTGSAIPEEGVKNLVHTKPELIIEAEELDFAREERLNDSLSKGEKRVVQEGQKGRKLRLVEVSQENGVESRKEVDAFVELEPVAEIREVGTKEVPAENPSDKPTPQPEPQPQPQPQPQPLPNPGVPLAPERPVQARTPQSSMEVKAVHHEVTEVAGKEVEKGLQTPAVSPAPVSEGTLPNTGTEESVASLVAGLLAAGLAGAVLDDKKKRADKAK
ncbi:Ig-like domain-containing protein [Streptococcus koreensis]|uniref:Ig-like domain-containing protein n=1 Tax=Streptococcus koreensis TaxID=2382163 RepID=UPI0022E19EAE|nr:Ig-like domain-containing protein [Streptococcus koreensis]